MDTITKNLTEQTFQIPLFVLQRMLAVHDCGYDRDCCDTTTGNLRVSADEKRGFQLFATDGKIAVYERFTFEQLGCEPFDLYEIHFSVLQVEILASFCKALKTKKTPEQNLITCHIDKVRTWMQLSHNGETTKIILDPRTYAQVERLLRTETSPKGITSFGINPNYVARLTKLWPKSSLKSEFVMQDNNGIRFSPLGFIKAQESYAIIMLITLPK